MYRHYILFVFLALSGNAMAQTSTGSQVWLDYNHKEFIKPDLSLYGDVGFRADVSDGDWYTIYIRPRIEYRANHIYLILFQ